TQNLEKFLFRYAYATNPPLPPNLCKAGGGEANLVDRVPLDSTSIDPPIGPETEAFFAQVQAVLEQVPVGGPMEEDPFAPCDLDKDGDCDDADRAAVQASAGSCFGDAGYFFLADHDGDGCVEQ